MPVCNFSGPLCFLLEETSVGAAIKQPARHAETSAKIGIVIWKLVRSGTSGVDRFIGARLYSSLKPDRRRFSSGSERAVAMQVGTRGDIVCSRRAELSRNRVRPEKALGFNVLPVPGFLLGYAGGILFHFWRF